MGDCAQIKARIDKRLKLRAKAALALSDMTLNAWIEHHLATWVIEVERQLGTPLDVVPHDAGVVEEPCEAAIVA